MLTNAPQIIPLWSYDEEHGYWIEESFAELDNSFYIGKVRHFSSWNVDTKGEAIEVSGQVYIRNFGNDLGASYYEILVCSESIGQRGGWLCDDGSFLFFNFPANEAFTLKIRDFCGNIVHEKLYNGFSEDTELSQILISTPLILNQLTLQGNAIDCDRDPVQNGFAYVDFETRRYTYNLTEEGSFQFLIPVCEEYEGALSILDLDQFLISDPVQVSDISEPFDFKDIIVCHDVSSAVNGEYFGTMLIDMGKNN